MISRKVPLTINVILTITSSMMSGLSMPQLHTIDKPTAKRTRKDMALSAISMNSALADNTKTINHFYINNNVTFFRGEAISRARNYIASLKLRKT